MNCMNIFYKKLLTVGVIGGCIGGGAGINGDIAGAMIDYFILISFISMKQYNKIFFEIHKNK